MDQSGVYALQDALTRLTGAGLRVLLVGIPTAHLDLLRSLQVVPHIVPEQDVFEDFEGLRAALPSILDKVQEQLAAGPTMAETPSYQ